MSDALIVGGGLAGAVAAIQLAQAGRAVTLIEKETAPHDKVCGEFLSAEAMGYLADLEIDLAALGAVPITRVVFEGTERRLPFAARSLSRRVLDEALLVKAEEVGATVLRGCKVQGIEQNNVKLDDGTVLRAPAIYLASGKHDVRGLRRGAGRQNDLVGFKMHYRLAPAQQQELEGAVELFLFPGGYGGLEPIEDGKANLCFLIRRSVLETVGGWDGALAHVHHARLEGAEALWDKPLAITAIPYGYVRRTSDDGIWRLGDQAAVIPSFSGDGMSIALHSGHLATGIFLAGGSAAQYQQALARHVGRQVAIATTLSQALVNPVGQYACKLGARLVPHLIGIAASATRIPEAALAV